MDRRNFLRSTAFLTVGTLLIPACDLRDKDPVFPETLEGNIAYLKHLCKDGPYEFTFLCINPGKEFYWKDHLRIKDKELWLSIEGPGKYTINLEKFFRDMMVKYKQNDETLGMSRTFRWFVDKEYDKYKKWHDAKYRHGRPEQREIVFG